MSRATENPSTNSLRGPSDQERAISARNARAAAELINSSLFKSAPSTKEADATLLADINRYDELWSEWDRVMVEGGEDDPRILALSEETRRLAMRIVATPAHTRVALNGKRRIIKREEFETYDDLGLIATILELDAERVARARSEEP